MDDLNYAIRFAAGAHANQVDKSGEPYILHLLRVMLAVSPEARVVALLHDLLEDTSWSAGELRLDGFSRRDVDAIVALTRVEGETYDDLITRCMADPLAREVKIADIRDNLSPARSAGCSPSMRNRYEAALERLTASPTPIQQNAGDSHGR